jgi:hypothetical protein
MPFSFVRLLNELGRDIPRPVFEPPSLAPLRKPLAESTVGLFLSCGVQCVDDPLLAETEDITFRLVHRDTPREKLVMAHKTVVRKWADEDINVGYPIDAMRALEADGTIGRLAHTAVSVVGSIERYTEFMEQSLPAVKAVYDAQGVDLVLMVPF